MAEDENNLSDYISHNGSILGAISLICGFLFTVIALLVSNFQSFNSLQAQSVLFGLTAIFDLSLYTLVDCLVMGIYFCRNIPPLTKNLKSFNLRLMLMFYFFGITTVILFLLWNLFYLAVVSALMWAIVVIFSYFNIIKPFYEYRKQKTCSNLKS